jgi:hypothetical protein
MASRTAYAAVPTAKCDSSPGIEVDVPQFNPALGTLESITYSYFDEQVVD